MLFQRQLLIAFFSCILLVSCKPEEDIPPVELGGKGGNGILKVTPKHHSSEIDSCTIYIKYNSLDVATVYDDSAKVVQVNNSPVATFGGLKKGHYYLYGKGWDTSINEAVMGGLPYELQQETAVSVTVPVTEDH